MRIVRSFLYLAGTCALLLTGCGGDGTPTGCTGAGCGVCTGASCGGNPTTVTVTFCGSTMPTAVAAKIGTGSFTTRTLSGSTLSLSIPAGTSNYAVAYLCPSPFNFGGVFLGESVWEASTADGTSVNFSCVSGGFSMAGMGTLTGSLDASAIPGAGAFEIVAQNGSAVQKDFQESTLGGSFSFSAPEGNDRVLVLVYDSSGQELLAAKNFNNQAVPGALNGGNTVAFGAADETTPGSIMYNSVPSGLSNPATVVELQMGGAEGTLPLVTATTQYPMLPAGALESGDFYAFDANTSSSSGSSSSSDYAGVVNSGGPVSLTFPAPWTYAGPTPAALPTFNINYTGLSGKSGVLYQAGFSWRTDCQLCSDSIGVYATAAYQGGSTTLAIPDLSGLTGFLAAPASGTTVQWGAQIYTPTYNYGANGTQTLNSSWSGVSNKGTFAVP